jgi:cell division protein FtsB
MIANFIGIGVIIFQAIITVSLFCIMRQLFRGDLQIIEDQRQQIEALKQSCNDCKRKSELLNDPALNVIRNKSRRELKREKIGKGK